MKLHEILEASLMGVPVNQSGPPSLKQLGKMSNDVQQLKLGTFGSLVPTQKCKQKLKFFMDDYHVQNQVLPDEMHCTLLQSLKFLPNFHAEGSLPQPIYANNLKCAIWNKKDPDAEGGKRNLLVVTFDSPDIIARRNKIIKANEKVYSEAEKKRVFVPHVILSYDIEDVEFDPDLLTYNLVKYIDILVFDSEHEAPLDLERTPSNASTR